MPDFIRCSGAELNPPCAGQAYFVTYANAHLVSLGLVIANTSMMFAKSRTEGLGFRTYGSMPDRPDPHIFLGGKRP